MCEESINTVNANLKAGKDLEGSIDKAIAECISKGILKEFLEKNRAAVRDALLYEVIQEFYENS